VWSSADAYPETGTRATAATRHRDGGPRGGRARSATRLPVTSLRPASCVYRTTRRTADRARRPDRHRTGPGPVQAARPAATNSTSATVRYATGGRSQAWTLFGPAARTAPVTTAYNPV